MNDDPTRRWLVGGTLAALVAAGATLAISSSARHSVHESLFPSHTVTAQLTKDQMAHVNTMGLKQSKRILDAVHLSMTVKQKNETNQVFGEDTPQLTSFSTDTFNDGGELYTNCTIKSDGHTITLTEESGGQVDKKSLPFAGYDSYTFDNPDLLAPNALTLKSAMKFLKAPGTHITSYETGVAPLYSVNFNEDGQATLSLVDGSDSGFDKPLRGLSLDDVKKDPTKMDAFITDHMDPSAY